MATQNVIVKSIEKGDVFVLDGETYNTSDLANLSKKELQRLGKGLLAEIKTYGGDGDEFSEAKDTPKSLIRRKEVVKAFYESKVATAEAAERKRAALKENEILEEADRQRQLSELQGLSAKDNAARRKRNLETIAECDDSDEEDE